VAVADGIDRYARFWMPFLYMTFTACLYSIDLSDSYIASDTQTDASSFKSGSHQQIVFAKNRRPTTGMANVKENASSAGNTRSTPAAQINLDENLDNSFFWVWMPVGSVLLLGWMCYRVLLRAAKRAAHRAQAAGSTTQAQYAARLAKRWDRHDHWEPYHR
jgi:hypothetical protein